MSEESSHHAHWRGSLRIVLSLLAVWAFVSLGCGVLLRDWLDANAPSVGGAPFGFWMAQQGAIVCFVVLLIVYRFLMNRLDQKHGLRDEDSGGER